jgi:hypothetical protein
MIQAARLIISAWKQGHPQVDRVLFWAASVIGRYALDGKGIDLPILKSSFCKYRNNEHKQQPQDGFGSYIMVVEEKIVTDHAHIQQHNQYYCKDKNFFHSCSSFRLP